MLTIWIIHRDADRRAALARIAGADDNTLIGHPGDEIFSSAQPADAVVLSLSGNFELELQFAHRHSARLADSRWIVLAEPADLAEARRLFDTIGAEFLPYPPTPVTLRRRLQRVLRRRAAEPLSQRGGRERLSQRFSRWFRDMEEVPELLRALDPRLSQVPLLIRGEPGTGRGLLARYVHTFGGHSDRPLIHVACAGDAREGDLLDAIADGTGDDGSRPTTVWFENADHLDPRLQRRVQDWIDFGLPAGRAPASQLRWIATAGEELAPDLDPRDRAVLDDHGSLDPQLAQSLAGLVITIAPLRNRPHAVEPFLLETVARWCASHGQRMRSIDPQALAALRQHPWPGNLRELESVIHRTLALTTAEVLLPVHLRFEGETWRLDFIDVDDRPLRQSDFAEPPFPVGPDEPPRAASSEQPVSPPPPSAPMPEPFEPDDLPPDAESLATLGGELVVDGELLPDPGGDFELIEAEPLTDLRAGEPAQAAGPDWPRLVTAIAHEVRNPLVSIRTFSELLPLHYEDEEFRTRFAELVGADVQRIEEVVDRLHALTDLGEGRPEPVDIAETLRSILDSRGTEIHEQSIVLLTELDAGPSPVLVDREPARAAFEAIVDRALATATPGSDLYVACKRHEWGLAGGPTVRVVLRFRGDEEPLAGGPMFEHDPVDVEGLGPDEVDLAYVLAEAVFRAQGGSLVIDGSLPGETLIAVDLPCAPDAL